MMINHNIFIIQIILSNFATRLLITKWAGYWLLITGKKELD